MPGVPAQQVVRVAHRPARDAPGAAGVLPLGLGRPPVPRPLPPVGRLLHPVGVLALLIRQVAPLVPANPFLLTQPVAVRRHVVPPDPVHRTILRRRELLEVLVVLAEAAELRHGHAPGRQGEAAVDPHPPALRPLPHVELSGRHEHHRLPLAVGVPPPGPLPPARRRPPSGLPAASPRSISSPLPCCPHWRSSQPAAARTPGSGSWWYSAARRPTSPPRSAGGSLSGSCPPRASRSARRMDTSVLPSSRLKSTRAATPPGPSRSIR